MTHGDDWKVIWSQQGADHYEWCVVDAGGHIFRRESLEAAIAEIDAKTEAEPDGPER